MNKTTLNTLFSSETDDWSTPIDFFNRLDQEYNFTLDPCASVANATCDYYFTEQDNGLNQDWGGYSVFMNPPYGRKMSKWVQKAYEEPIVLKLAKKYEGQLRFFLVHDKKDNAELGKLFKIDGVPSIFLFSRGGRIEVPYPEYGFNEKYLDEKFANYLQTQKGE